MVKAPSIKGPAYDYYRRFFPGTMFQDLCTELLPLCSSQKIRDLKRSSCTFAKSIKNVGDAKATLFSYNQLTSYEWEKSPIIKSIKDTLEKEFGTYFDYCLAHYYPTGSSSIAWHNDKEALETDVISVSFGATRKFRFRKMGDTKGYCKEFNLSSGDLLHMLNGCQKIYEHTVPVEKKVTEPRINLTFRKIK